MSDATAPPEARMTIESLLKSYGRRLGLRTVAGGQGMQRTINSSDVHRPGLTLTGFVEVFTFDLVQILGNHELEYLRSLSPDRRRQALEIIYQFELPCVIVTGRGRLLPDLRLQPHASLEHAALRRADCEIQGVQALRPTADDV